ncbi:hypothetical protein CY0110_18072 [Crocosphaera chwakensis CCY0110]|uniref:Uncharacterized protein n=1 Tax=Crocosphaera chwakensis CCY0110 TaxID=391612 RepID=A3IIU6_9CHRO|nr:hypothetical protein CY0110_18072 [Crocosphaera chwakensis CCY0110]
MSIGNHLPRIHFKLRLKSFSKGYGLGCNHLF